MDKQTQRKHYLLELGANKHEAEELLRYNANRFDNSLLTEGMVFPLEDEPFAAIWEGYVREAEHVGVYHILKQKLVQLSFPVNEGISQTEAYRAVTLRGEDAKGFETATGNMLHQPDRIELFLHPTAAGRIPVLVIHDRSDFVCIVQALSCRNEPKVLPDSMGACMIKGYNNWDRINRYKTEWLEQHPEGDWNLEFIDFKEHHDRYRDRLIVLSDGPYSGVNASAMGLTEMEWQEKSLIIRLEHECTHYMTLRLLGSMQNNLFDELLADYMGLMAAFGEYSAARFLTFMGIAPYPEYPSGGRMKNYRGNPPLSDGAFLILTRIVADAAANLEKIYRLDGVSGDDGWSRMRFLLQLSLMTLDELSSPDALQKFPVREQPPSHSSGVK